MVRPFPRLLISIALGFAASVIPPAVIAVVFVTVVSAASAAPLRVACVGDSITAGSGTSGGDNTYPAWLGLWLGADYEVRNFGVSGATLLTQADRPYIQQQAYADALAFRPDILVVKLGTNDSKHPETAGATAPDNWRHKAGFVADYEALIAAFRAVSPTVKVYLCLPVPAYPGRWGINGRTIREEIVPLVREVAAHTDATIIDTHAALSDHPELFPDTVHPNDHGARLIAATVLKSLTGADPAPPPTIPVLTVGARPSPLAGRRVLWLGDSITQDGRYVTFVEYFLNRAYPAETFDIVGIGLASETLSGLSEKEHPFPRPCVHQRLARALDQVKPAVVVACYGMNDGIYHPAAAERQKAFQDGVLALIAAVRAAGAELVLLTPPPFDPVPLHERNRPAGATDYSYRHPFQDYDAVLADFARWELTLAAPDIRVIDLHTPLAAYLAKGRAADPRFRLSNDGIHPASAGHLLMARLILGPLGLEVTIKDEELATTAAQLGLDPLFQLVKKHRQLRSGAWLDFIGYTRDKTVLTESVATAETQAAELQVRIDAARRP